MGVPEIGVPAKLSILTVFSLINHPAMRVLPFIKKTYRFLWIQMLAEKLLHHSNHKPVILPQKVLASIGIGIK
jgi:hypothetical protein